MIYIHLLLANENIVAFFFIFRRIIATVNSAVSRPNTHSHRHKTVKMGRIPPIIMGSKAVAIHITVVLNVIPDILHGGSSPVNVIFLTKLCEHLIATIPTFIITLYD